MNHEDHEGHETKYKPFSMRLHSPLSQEAEHAMTETIGCAIAAHRALGPGFLEDVHQAQVTSYLRTTGLRGGLLINFRVPILKNGLRRIVL